jgi:Cytoskeletal-regulatory complex EF hand
MTADLPFYDVLSPSQPYYDGLFAIADTQRAGSIGGTEAVRFFQTSGLPVEALKTVWTVADQPASNQLDKRKFAVAVRLIQLLQNNAKGEGASLAAPDGVVLKPVHFEGISGVRVAMPPPDAAVAPAPAAPQPPPQQQQQYQQPPPPQQQQYQQQQQQYQPQQAPMTPPRPPVHPPAAGGSVVGGGAGPMMMTSTALTTQDPFVMTPAERQRYESLFPQYATKDGYVYGAQAVELFSKSGVPQPQLAAIWNMVDIGPVDNRLDPLEFAMAMHMIVCVSKKNLPLPPTLPYSLKLLKEQQQQQQPPAMVVPQQGHQPTFSQPGSPVSAARAAPTPPPTMTMSQQQQQQPRYGNYQQPPPGQGTMTMGVPRVQTPYHQQQQQQQQAGANSIPSPGPQMSGIPEPAPSSAFSSLPSPPPLSQPAGGLSISDAFEGLGGGLGGMASPSYVAPVSSFGGYGGDASVSSAQDEMFHIPDPAPVMSVQAPAPASSP